MASDPRTLLSTIELGLTGLALPGLLSLTPLLLPAPVAVIGGI